MASDNRPEKVVALLDIEERLLADEDGLYRKELACALADLEASTQARQRAMTAPDEYARLQKLAKGVKAAKRVLEHCCRPGADRG